MSNSPSRARLIVADSEQCADMLYATRFFAPDPFVYVHVPGTPPVVLVSDLEIDRAMRTIQGCEVASWSEVLKQAGRGKRSGDEFVHGLAWYLKSRKIRGVEVPSGFPLGLARGLERRGVRVYPTSGAFWPEREIKNAQEIKAIAKALRITEAGMARAMEVLRASRPRKNGSLYWGNSVLTSERLRAEADAAILQKGGLPKNSIVAGGEQACDPHERGSGPLRAHTLMVIDLFPRDAESGYFGDMTRTVVRGRATPAQREIWNLCLVGQQKALKAIRPGIKMPTLRDEIRKFFEEKGFPTIYRDGRWSGFFHGLGHGLGLEIHESLGRKNAPLRAHQVVTVEPGIYVPSLGGVRHEDVVVLASEGCKKLSRFPKVLEI